MQPNALKIRPILTVVLLVIGLCFPVCATDFKIKPVVVSGKSAPAGGTFLDVGITPRALNNKGDILFFGRTSFIVNGGGWYVVSDTGTINLLLKDGSYTTSGRLPDPQSLGIAQVACPFGPSICALFEFQSKDFFKLPDGHLINCEKETRSSGGLARINDSHDLIWQGGLLSGGSINSLTCPTMDYLSHIFFDHKETARGIHDIGGITNTGTIALRVETFGKDNPILFIKGGRMSIIDLIDTTSPLGTIAGIGSIELNEHETLLVPFRTSTSSFFPQGLLMISGESIVPVGFTGSPAPGGRSFGFFSGVLGLGSVALNNSEQIAFAASLNDGSEGIFRRDPDGTVTALSEDRRVPGFLSATRSLSINDKGEVAAWLFKFWEFPAKTEILFFNSKGIKSKVVGSNDPAPGGAKFQFVDSPNLNNKGEIFFHGILSDGTSGIFLASGGLETEFVDPVPDLLVGSTVPFVPAELATKGRKVTGIAADGAAQVVVRVKTGQPGTVEFLLMDSQGNTLPANNLNGSLSQVSSPNGSSTVSAQAQDIQGVGPMAFAAYHAPMDFSSSPNSVEAGLVDRQVFIKVKLTTSTGETVESTEPLKIVRPPVVLVHGLWGSPKAWDAFSPLNGTSMFWVNLADYEDSHARALTFNMPLMALQTKASVLDFKLTRQVAAIQADVVTHSMGGLLMRMLPLLEDVYFRDDNFGHGDVHKLINIDTPHLGTPLARFLQLSLCVSRFFDSHDHPTGQGAVEDLIPGSRALREINNVSSSVELHNIVGLTGIAGIELTEGSLAYLWLRLRCRRDFRGIPVSGFLDAVLGTPDHDLIVPGVSQQGRATTNVTTVTGVIHTQVEFFFQGVGVLESTDTSNRVINLLNTPINSPEFDNFVGFP